MSAITSSSCCHHLFQSGTVLGYHRSPHRTTCFPVCREVVYSHCRMHIFSWQLAFEESAEIEVLTVDEQLLSDVDDPFSSCHNTGQSTAQPKQVETPSLSVWEMLCQCGRCCKFAVQDEGIGDGCIKKKEENGLFHLIRAHPNRRVKSSYLPLGQYQLEKTFQTLICIIYNPSGGVKTLLVQCKHYVAQTTNEAAKHLDCLSYFFLLLSFTACVQQDWEGSTHPALIPPH